MVCDSCSFRLNLLLAHKLKTSQLSSARGEQVLRIAVLMSRFHSLGTAGKAKISTGVRDQRLNVDTGFNLTQVLMSMVVTEELPVCTQSAHLSLRLVFRKVKRISNNPSLLQAKCKKSSRKKRIRISLFSSFW